MFGWLWFFFFSSRRRHTRCGRDWSSDVCSSDLRRRPMPAGQPTAMTPAQVERFKETPRCIACAACYSACPAAEVDPEFPGPMALAKLYRFVVDPRDTAHQERLVRIQPNGLWLCLR